jgi:phenylacetate-CoA ligase
MDHPASSAQETAFERFLSQSLDDVIGLHESEDPDAAVLELFRQTVANVPAYRDFLERHGVRPEVRSIGDFRQLPLMTKADYMQAYPLPERCRGGSLAGLDRVAVSSGSTGQPTFWPRSAIHELTIAHRFEQVFRDSFAAHRNDTLAVVCFALGNWVGGLFTTSCCWHLARKGYPLMVATPGNKKEEIFRVVRELGPYYKQTVLLGYPPFVKDVIDAGLAEGLDWSRYRVRTVFAGEVFSEEWRSEVLRRAGSASPCYDSASLYGTADGGVLGNETPLSIAARRFLAANPEAARQLFGESRLPTLVQYDPLDRYFERHGDTLVVSGNNGVPLVRYHIADRGGLVSHEGLWSFLRDFGVRSLRDYGLDEDRPSRRLPFVWVFGRADFTVSFYGANIYPENVAVGLEQPGIMSWITGKFVMEAKESRDADHYLSIAVELLPNVSADPEKAFIIAESIRKQLLRLNSEFANYTPEDKQLPWVSLLPFEDSDYFAPGVKHRYSRR